MADKSWQKDIKMLSKEDEYIGIIQYMQFPIVFDLSCMGNDLDAYGNKKTINHKFTPVVATIIREAISNYYGVFFGEKFSYLMKSPNGKINLDYF